MADLITDKTTGKGKGKFYGVDSAVPYSSSFDGLTKVPQKVKVGGAENKPDGYVVDAIDIDWGGLKLTTITPEWGTQTISSTTFNAGKCNNAQAKDNTAGIKSSGFLLEKISDSLSAIREFIGYGNNIDNDYKDALSYEYKDMSPYTVTGHLADALNKIGDWSNIYNMSMSSVIGNWGDNTYSISEVISDIQHILGDASSVDEIVTKIDLIKGELEGNVNDWTTLVDKLNGLGDNTVASYVASYVSDALSNFETEPDWSYVIGTAANTAADDTIYGAKAYATDAINTATYAVIGTDNDDKNSDTIYGAKKYAYSVAADASYAVLGEESDDLGNGAYTVHGVINYATALSSTIDNITLAGFNVQRIEEDNEGILVFTDLNSYLNPPEEEEEPGE